MKLAKYDKGTRVYVEGENSLATVLDDLNEAYGIDLYDCGVTVLMDSDGAIAECARGQLRKVDALDNPDVQNGLAEIGINGLM